jgi:hypothetical protein
MTIFEIRDKLINDEIDYSDAFELIKKFPKAWHTKEWDEKREKVLKNYCEQCKSTEGVMVVQHLSHPPEFKTIRNEIFNSLLNEILASTTLPKPVITKDDIKEFYDKTTEIGEVCPNCRSGYIRKRKTKKPEYYCDTCKTAFDEVTTIQYNKVFGVVVPDEEQVFNHLFEEKKKEAISDFKKKLYAEHEKHIGKKALLISIDLHLKYMELENVVTFCKSCAYRMDKQGKLLCWTCKTDYFDYLFYECCYKCYEKNEVTKNPIKVMIWKNIQDANYNS